jgi:DUF177 domain-containing protein
MFIDLLQVPPDGQELDIALPPQRWSIDRAELRLVDIVRLSGRLDPADEASFRLVGSLGAKVELECVRCLEPFRMGVEEALDLVFLPASENVAPGKQEERELKDEDLAVSFYRDDSIDLGLLVREQVLLALPMKPICRADCRGLCPECGTNLNLSPCNCAREAVDPRLANLKTLLKQ